jgi:hypothetical protein
MNEQTINQGGQKVNNPAKANVELKEAHDQIVRLRLILAAYWDRLDPDIQSRIRIEDTLEIK